MMTTLEIWLIAVGLAMDCFAISIASGILLKRFQWKTMLLMAIYFGLFQGIMPLLGWIGSSFFSHLIEEVDHWIAFGILAFLGGRMIRDFFKEEEERQSFDPKRLRVILVLAVATSIDALAVGISFAFLGIRSWNDIFTSTGIIAWVSFVLSLIGLCIGIMFGNGFARRLKAELLGGIILVIIGIKILVEHLLIN